MPGVLHGSLTSQTTLLHAIHAVPWIFGKTVTSFDQGHSQVKNLDSWQEQRPKHRIILTESYHMR